jgi:pyridoxal phosphate enzyme (YggS family)
LFRMSIAENIARVRERMEAAARRAARSPGEIELMAVSKTVAPEQIADAHAAGLRLFGENRVQEFAAKADSLRGLAEARWHLIGHLQTNKAGKAAELFAAVESVDSVRLAEKLDTAAGATGKMLEVLIEVNLWGEPTKSGVRSKDELNLLLDRAPEWPNLQVRGLMAIPPFFDDLERVRRHFRQMRDLRDEIARSGLPAVRMDVLSMGMSHDFEVAIEEGSTRVRVGTAIFGERPSR